MQNQVLRQICEKYPWHWADQNHLRVLGGVFDIVGRNFQMQIMNDDVKIRRRVYRKCTQALGTESYVLIVLHGMIYKIYKRGFIYTFPTRDEVTDFSDSRFKPLIDNNLCIKKYVRSTDRNNLKKIHDAFLYLRGNRLQDIDDETPSSSKLKSIPGDGFAVDEVDEVEEFETVQGLLRGRLAQSDIKHEFYLGNPTIPDYGISMLYDESDQQVWMVKCQHCGEWNNLEAEFPECLVRQKDRSVYRACKKCRDEVFPVFGEWVPTYKEKSEYMVGRTISHLNLMTVDPRDILDQWESPRLKKQVFYNTVMGMPYISAEDRLTKADIYKCCDNTWLMPNTHQGPAYMGVDVQGEKKGLHVVIGVKLNDYSHKLLKLARVNSVADLHDLVAKYHVECAVVDAKPETRLMKVFAEEAKCEVFLNNYNPSQLKYPDFNSIEHLVSLNRVEACDATHEMFVTEGRIKLPRRNSEIEEYARQMINTAKRLQENEKKGIKEYKYVKLGDDDYYHASNYAFLASQRVGNCRREEVIAEKKKTDKWGNWGSEIEHKAGSFMGL